MANYTLNTQNGNAVGEQPLTGNHARDEKIRELRRSNPRVYSYRKLGRIYNISSTRVSQIVNTAPQEEGSDHGR